MQLEGKKATVVWVLLGFCVCAICFGSGLMVGRQFPTHRFEKMANSHYLYDTTTGRVCDFWPSPATTNNPIDQIWAANSQPSIPHCSQQK